MATNVVAAHARHCGWRGCDGQRRYCRSCLTQLAGRPPASHNTAAEQTSDQNRDRYHGDRAQGAQRTHAQDDARRQYTGKNQIAAQLGHHIAVHTNAPAAVQACLPRPKRPSVSCACSAPGTQHGSVARPANKGISKALYREASRTDGQDSILSEYRQTTHGRDKHTAARGGAHSATIRTSSHRIWRVVHVS